jgi:hypothetical protein
MRSGWFNKEKINFVQGGFCVKQKETNYRNTYKKLEGVKVGTSFVKWGNSDEKLLNGVIIIKLGGKNGNLLYRHHYCITIYMTRSCIFL